MSGPPVNLNKARKARARDRARREADENAVRFGRSKAERDREAAERAQAESRHEEHRVGPLSEE